MNRAQEFICCFIGCNLLTFHLSVSAKNIDPTELSIEQLMASKVSTVSRTEQNFADTASALYVISQDDIQRSGVTNIPDVLRLAPGIQVARISASEWAVTARGFNGRFANKLLVLLDGRTVYSPTFAGVRWENLDLILDDIERIEVIRGPGASVWGHNAVNGVINIITKHTEDTQQQLVSVTAGNEEQAIVELRHGSQLNDNTYYRVFGKYLRRDQSIDLQNNQANDDWTQGRGGFRLDWNSYKGNRLMLEGNGYISNFNESFLLPADDQLNTATRKNSEQNSGASFLARWDHDFSMASSTHTQFYYEFFKEDYSEFSNERSHTFDIDFQHDIALSADNHFNWGLAYRFVNSSLSDGIFAFTDPANKNLHLASAFLQDKTAFFDNKIHLTVGTKIQYYTLSGWSYQPSVRLMWKLHPQHRIWASFSRASRSPSRAETAIHIKPLPISNSSPATFEFQGNPEFDEEQVISYELGYRSWLNNRLSFDMALFYNQYKDLFSGVVGQPDLATGRLPISIQNSATAQTWGVEAAIDWRPIDPLRLQLAYSFLQINFDHNNSSSSDNRPKNEPKNQFSLRSSYNISPTVFFDTWVRYVGSTQALDTFFSPKRKIDSYVTLDLRLAWTPISSLELSLTAQNLNDSAHQEYVEETFAYPRQVERSLYGKVKWSF